MDMFAALSLSLSCLMLQRAGGELDYISHGQGMRLQGDFSIAGFFPLHYEHEQSGGLPAVGSCNK